MTYKDNKTIEEKKTVTKTARKTSLVHSFKTDWSNSAGNTVIQLLTPNISSWNSTVLFSICLIFSYYFFTENLRFWAFFLWQVWPELYRARVWGRWLSQACVNVDVDVWTIVISVTGVSVWTFWLSLVAEILCCLWRTPPWQLQSEKWPCIYLLKLIFWFSRTRMNHIFMFRFQFYQDTVKFHSFPLFPSYFHFFFLFKWVGGAFSIINQFQLFSFVPLM